MIPRPRAVLEECLKFGVKSVEQRPRATSYSSDFTFDFGSQRPPLIIRVPDAAFAAAADPVRLLVRCVESHVAANAIPPPAPEPDHSAPAPRRTGKALGFRSWKLDGYKLYSANPEFGDWKIGEPTQATCSSFMGHAAPAPDCECGLYALHSPEFASRWHSEDPLMVHGAVLGWGRMEVHGEGWRAQYAQPVILAIDGERQPRNHCQRVQALGAELGLPVVEWDEFEARARELGEPVPEDLRPATMIGSGSMILPGGAQYTPPAPFHLAAPHFATPNFTVAQLHAFAGVPAPKPRRRGIGWLAWWNIAFASANLALIVVGAGHVWNVIVVGVCAGIALRCTRPRRGTAG